MSINGAFFEQDDKFDQLYGQISNVHLPYTSQQQKLLKQAQQKTEVNSHYTNIDPKKIIQNCYVYPGMSLVQSSQPNYLINKYRPHTIIKATQKTKQPISQEQLRSRLANSHHKEIIYTFNNLHSRSKSNSIPIQAAHINRSSIFNTIINNHKSTQPNLKRTSNRSSAKLNVTSRQKIQPRRVEQPANRVEQPNNRVSQNPVNSGLNRTRNSQLLAQAQPIVSQQMEQTKYAFKSMKDRVTGKLKTHKKHPYNCYSCIDEPCNNAQQSQNQTWYCFRNQGVATKLGALKWKK